MKRLSWIILGPKLTVFLIKRDQRSPMGRQEEAGDSSG